jgi:uncharacterized membrane protein HdeD (DUF308 family)
MIFNNNVVKWFARILGGVAVVFFGVFYIGGGIPDLVKEADSHLRSMMILMSFAVLGYIFSLFREKEGGWILAFSGFVIGLTMFYNSGMKDILFALVFSVPFLISGLLFVYAAGKGDK